MTDSDKPHLSQQNLEDIENIDNILQTLGKWLQTAKFEAGKKEGTENCADPEMPEEADRLLDALGFKKMDSGRKKYNVLRIHGPRTTRIGSKADIVPIQVWGFDPTLNGTKLNMKSITHITKGVEIGVGDGSILDLLIVAQRE